MRSIRTGSSVISQIFLLLIIAAPLFAESMGVSDGHDLDRLWAQAEKEFDLSSQDAVLLLESRHITILESGGLRARIHRVVWIGTETGIRDYADLRVPYNSAASSLKVIKLRTWRDEKWWPDKTKISSIAVVETLPFELTGADDYTDIRETMLLHDGVEIPCIMETVYEIEEFSGAKYGSDALWVFPRHDSAVLVEYNITIPEDYSFHFINGNDAPVPEVNRNAEKKATYRWKMEKVGRLGSPRIADPASYAPYLVWSTWKDWDRLGRKITSNFDEAACLNGALVDTLAQCIEDEPGTASKARAVVDLVNEYTSGIHYNSRFWFLSPRPAERTWETAYGHCLDRAVLAAALLREAGLNAEPIYRSERYIDHSVPGLSRFREIGLVVSGGSFKGFYDPAEGKLYEGLRPLHGWVVWEPGSGDAPRMLQDSGTVSMLNLILTLKPGEGKSWDGTGFFNADGLFCPYDEMAGLRGEAAAFIGKMASSVLEGTDVSGFNPEIFNPGLVNGGFEFKVKGEDPDQRGRTRITIGDPAGGIISNLPSDVHLYHERRTSPVLLRGKMIQRIRLRIKTDEKEIVYLPEAKEIENEAGRYILSVRKEEGWVTIDRELSLNARAIGTEMWPELRALLLEETDSAGRTILLK